MLRRQEVTQRQTELLEDTHELLLRRDNPHTVFITRAKKETPHDF